MRREASCQSDDPERISDGRDGAVRYLSRPLPSARTWIQPGNMGVKDEFNQIGR